ncbi:MAG: prepilin-type N-terminal cleavage/methylation domain-containing protein [Clostridiales Family XIII bacterium]|jgi:prepilin-type N-terminal cleavage/methylation domain-containing protein|nr:prepilin-type N-terminal cleavage/methylation domain-containing protein [Clostridiales Family XIII bacterium]
MNMILKKGIANTGNGANVLLFPSPGGVPRSGGVVGHDRKGFTLVEVIVVLVILAILAAIAIPALTGYIDKAEDKKYIADARNAIVAVRAVLDEKYAEGTLGKGDPEYFANGNNWISNPSHVFKAFDINTMSQKDTDTGTTSDGGLYVREAAKLIGVKSNSDLANMGDWSVALYGPKGAPGESTCTMLTAPIYLYISTTDIVDSKQHRVIVSYGVDYTIDPKSITTWTQFWNIFGKSSTSYNPNAGYKVFHVVR